MKNTIFIWGIKNRIFRFILKISNYVTKIKQKGDLPITGSLLFYVNIVHISKIWVKSIHGNFQYPDCAQLTPQEFLK